MIGLADRSHKPQGRQHQMSAQTQVRVIELLGQSLFNLGISFLRLCQRRYVVAVG